MVDLNSSSQGLFSIMDWSKCTLASLISFGMMFALTIYLVLLSFRFRGCHKKRGERRCRVSSPVWTRRKVFWLQRGQSRTVYVFASMESSAKARKSCGKEAPERIEEVSTKYCSNILKIITLAFTAVMACTELQIVYDLHQDKQIQSLSNFTLKSRNSGYALGYRDKAKLKKPTLLSLTQFGFGMGPSFLLT